MGWLNGECLEWPFESLLYLGSTSCYGRAWSYVVNVMVQCREQSGEVGLVD